MKIIRIIENSVRRNYVRSNGEPDGQIRRALKIIAPPWPSSKAKRHRTSVEVGSTEKLGTGLRHDVHRAGRDTAVPVPNGAEDSVKAVQIIRVIDEAAIGEKGEAIRAGGTDSHEGDWIPVRIRRIS